MSGSHPRAVSHGRSPLDAWTALMISRTLDGFPGISVPLGLLEPVNRLKLDYVEKQLKAFDRYAREYPKETTLAVIAHLDRLDLEGPSLVGVEDLEYLLRILVQRKTHARRSRKSYCSM